MINVRLQNDMKVPVEQRRNYKHVFDGLYRVTKHEGGLLGYIFMVVRGH